MLGGIITIAGGTLASSGFIISKKPNAKELIDKIVPYTGWIGMVMFLWGVWELIGVVTHLGLLSSHPLWWTFWLLAGVADISVGFMLGFGLISKYALSKNQAALERGQNLRARLVPLQTILGFLAIVMGLLYILAYLRVF